MEEVDVAIRFGNFQQPGLSAETLMPEMIVPVAVPEIAARSESPPILCTPI